MSDKKEYLIKFSSADEKDQCISQFYGIRSGLPALLHHPFLLLLHLMGYAITIAVQVQSPPHHVHRHRFQEGEESKEEAIDQQQRKE